MTRSAALLAAFLTSVSPMEADQSAVCELVPLHTGVCQLGEDHVLGEGHSASKRLEFVIYSFLVRGPSGEVALIDLGPKSLDYSNRMFRRYGFFRDLGPELSGRERFPDDIVQPHGNVLVQLEGLGLSPADVDHVVFTHLHADHHGMDDASDGGAAESFARARLHVSGRGWKANLDRRSEAGWNSYVDYAFSDFLLRRGKEGTAVFHDDAEIFPGLRTLYLGGHSVCSQAAIVATREGPVVITSDEVYLYELLAGDVMPRVRTSQGAYRKALDRLVETAVRERAILVPLHDPVVWEAWRRHGDRWLERLRVRSDDAVRSYLVARRRTRRE